MCVCVGVYIRVLLKMGFPTFEKISLLIKQLVIHLSRKKVNKLSNTKTEEHLQEK